MVSFSQLPAVKKDAIFGAARKIFHPWSSKVLEFKVKRATVSRWVDICSLMNFWSIIFCLKLSLTYFEQAKDGAFLSLMATILSMTVKNQQNPSDLPFVMRLLVILIFKALSKAARLVQSKSEKIWWEKNWHRIYPWALPISTPSGWLSLKLHI